MLLVRLLRLLLAGGAAPRVLPVVLLLWPLVRSSVVLLCVLSMVRVSMPLVLPSVVRTVAPRALMMMVVVIAFAPVLSVSSLMMCLPCSRTLGHFLLVFAASPHSVSLVFSPLPPLVPFLPLSCFASRLRWCGPSRPTP